MSDYRFYVRLRFTTGEQSTVVVTARSSSNAMRWALHRLLYEYKRYDVQSMYISGDPIPVEKLKRKAALKEKKAEQRRKNTVWYDGLTRRDSAD